MALMHRATVVAKSSVLHKTTYELTDLQTRNVESETTLPESSPEDSDDSESTNTESGSDPIDDSSEQNEDSDEASDEEL